MEYLVNIGSIIGGIIVFFSSLVYIIKCLIDPIKDQVNNQIGAIKDQLDPIKEQVNNHIPTQIRELSNRVDKVNDRLDKINDRLDKLFELQSKGK